MKIIYGKDADGDLVLSFDNGDITGTFVKAVMDDHTGVELMLNLATFYESKGHDTRRLLANYLREFEVERPAQRWTWKRLFQFLRGK